MRRGTSTPGHTSPAAAAPAPVPRASTTAPPVATHRSPYAGSSAANPADGLSLSHDTPAPPSRPSVLVPSPAGLLKDMATV